MRHDGRYFVVRRTAPSSARFGATAEGATIHRMQLASTPCVHDFSVQPTTVQGHVRFGWKCAASVFAKGTHRPGMGKNGGKCSHLPPHDIPHLWL